MSRDGAIYYHTINLLYVLKRLNFRPDLLEEAKTIVTTRFMYSGIVNNIGTISTPHMMYPVAPPRNTWSDKVIVGISIMLAAAITIIFIAGVWKCSLLLYACL